MRRPLPLEVWLLIVDELGAAREYDALEACAEASSKESQLLNERAKKYIPNELGFRTPEEVASIRVARKLGWLGPKCVRIEGGEHRGERLPIPHLATFASRLARKWYNVSVMVIKRAEWRAQDLDSPSLSLNLCYFASITRLHLHDVAFPTVRAFWRLVCAFPDLVTLRAYDIEIANTAIDARTLAALRLLSAPVELGVIEIVTEQPGDFAARTDCAKLFQAITPQAVPFLKTSLWSLVSELDFQHVTCSTAAAFARLLCALPALKKLSIRGPCTFLEQSTDVPDMTFRLDRLDLGKDFSLQSESQSVDALIGLFTQPRAGGGLRDISVWLSPYLRVMTSTDVALNRLVKHAGRSLSGLGLRALPEDGFRLYSKASILAAPNTVRSFNIAANTDLSFLGCSIEFKSDKFQDSPLLEMLHNITSEWITHVSVTFQVKNAADLPRFWIALSQLDLALSRNAFTNLRRVRLYLCGIEVTNMISDCITLCLRRLYNRDILKCVAQTEQLRLEIPRSCWA
ncbi:hypothetical protein POSPLADRAFT_1131289 [Postia placenta MAD-698-R-SB12]|uniref:F-box domain-containing protein n=1 Tax=Postia placenta MAD-698-R-SB12 TaxID=670580 RepID=A0A1X6NBF3_9APHY|nr:hypothetical protein POSPLADRAFT_1131289 [Postia placenta MAD-698-R-SB12]OSX65968.1 hypothetical protein POSPLADRAFT_1131289 [Postia placenta MAD-698-R-SB12]